MMRSASSRRQSARRRSGSRRSTGPRCGPWLDEHRHRRHGVLPSKVNGGGCIGGRRDAPGAAAKPRAGALDSTPSTGTSPSAIRSSALRTRRSSISSRKRAPTPPQQAEDDAEPACSSPCSGFDGVSGSIAGLSTRACACVGLRFRWPAGAALRDRVVGALRGVDVAQQHRHLVALARAVRAPRASAVDQVAQLGDLLRRDAVRRWPCRRRHAPHLVVDLLAQLARRASSCDALRVAAADVR